MKYIEMQSYKDSNSVINPEKLLELVMKHAVKIDGEVYRLYKRFRADKWYGGIATGDVVGCNLRCGMCWAWKISFSLSGGVWMSPVDVAVKLEEIAKSRGFRQVRISGGEPLIAPRHLLKVADHLADYTFVVETNGLLITRDLAREFANRPQVIVRVSIKGATPEEFSKITQSPPYYFHRQIEAIKILVESGLKPCVDVYPAAMLGFSTDETIKSLEETLAGVDPRLSDCIDVEYVILYPHVVKLLRARGLTPTKAVTPSGIPTFMI